MRNGLVAGWFLAAILFAFGLVVAARIGAWPGGSDSSGYLNAARLLREGRFHESRMMAPGLVDYSALPDFLAVPLGFRPSGTEEMTPTYPLGLPALIAAASWVVGAAAAPDLVLWLHAMAACAAVFLLARTMRLGRGWSVFGVLMLATSPLVLSYSTQAMSDVPAMAWVSLALLLAWRRGSSAVLAGTAFGLAVFVRPSNALALAALGVCLRTDWRAWVRFLAGGAPVGAAWLLTNHHVYGEYLTTGYGDVGSDFGRSFVVPTLAHVATWLPVVAGPAVAGIVALPLAGRRTAVRRLLFVVAWVLPWVAFYACYRFTHTTWWYLRFLLPCLPGFILGALLGLRAVSRLVAGRRVRTAFAAVAVGASVAWSVYWIGHLYALESGDGDRVYVDAMQRAEAVLPDNAVVVAWQVSGSMAYLGRWPLLRLDFVDARSARLVETRVKAAGRPLCAILFPFEVEPVRKLFPGRWTQVDQVRQISIWRWEPDAGGAAVCGRP